jgi:hypothetical protein
MFFGLLSMVTLIIFVSKFNFIRRLLISMMVTYIQKHLPLLLVELEIMNNMLRFTLPS